jgi:hypothetical protein
VLPRSHWSRCDHVEGHLCTAVMCVHYHRSIQMRTSVERIHNEAWTILLIHHRMSENNHNTIPPMPYYGASNAVDCFLHLLWTVENQEKLLCCLILLLATLSAVYNVLAWHLPIEQGLQSPSPGIWWRVEASRHSPKLTLSVVSMCVEGHRSDVSADKYKRSSRDHIEGSHCAPYVLRKGSGNFNLT